MSEGERSLVGVRYMAGFGCIGADCEANCCGHWTVIVDEKHYQRVLAAAAGDSSRRHELAHAFELRPEAERDRRFVASIRLRSNGMCPLLAVDGLCSLHRDGGEAWLPDACAVYPRKLSRVGDRFELSGSLSCPEVARRALLGEGALDLIPFAESEAGRPLVFQVWGEHSDDDDARHLNLVRQSMSEHADRTSLPLSARLLCMLALSIETESLFGDGGRLLDLAAFEQAVARLRQPEAVAFLAQRCAGGGTPSPGAMHVVLSVLGVHLRSYPQSPLAPYIEGALSRFLGAPAAPPVADPPATGSASTDSVPAGSTTTDSPSAGSTVTHPPLADSLEERCLALAARPTAVLCAHLELRDRLLAEATAATARLDLYFRNYLKLFWLREWHVRAPSLRVHVQDLLVRVAVLRFLLLGHPETGAALAADELADLDRLAVEIFSSFSRAVEHDKQFLGGLARTLARDLLPPADWIGMLCL